MTKSLNDIDINKIDLNKHKIIIPKGTALYRVIEKGRDPLIPSGKECRFAKEPQQYTPEKYAEEYKQGHGALVGTGNICGSFCLEVAIKESGGYVKNPVTYKITLKLDIEAVNMDSICVDEGIPKPYITEDREGVWHEFYGEKVKAIRYESLKDNANYNLVMFPDSIDDFANMFIVEEILGENLGRSRKCQHIKL